MYTHGVRMTYARNVDANREEINKRKLKKTKRKCLSPSRRSFSIFMCGVTVCQLVGFVLIQRNTQYKYAKEWDGTREQTENFNGIDYTTHAIVCWSAFAFLFCLWFCYILLYWWVFGFYDIALRCWTTLGQFVFHRSCVPACMFGFLGKSNNWNYVVKWFTWTGNRNIYIAYLASSICS